MRIGFGNTGPAGQQQRSGPAPRTMAPRPFNLTANQGHRFDLTGVPVNGLILTVLTGQVDGYFGEFSASGQAATAPPHFLGLAGETYHLPLTGSEDYIITLQEGVGSTATGTIIFLYREEG